ncbi:MAG: NAD(P)-dependent oxidoreductase [Spirochaetaceae bacterium]|nr:NAD(P)-dependent oxidoreductase [Spirochaetaceae bacterium]
MKKTRILITGAAGAVGTETLKELIKNESHFQVRTFDLPGKRTAEALKPFRKKIEIIAGSINDYSILEKAVSDVDIVIHLAAIIPPSASKNPTLAWKVNVDGTQTLIQAIRKKAPEAFLLFSSSVSVYGDRVKTPWICVDDKLNPSDGDGYGAGKIAAENIVRESGLNYSIFRFTGIMGTQHMKAKGIDPMFFHMPLETSYEIATTRDTGFALSRIPYHIEELQERTFNLAGGESCRTSYQEFLKQTLTVTGLGFEGFPPEAFATQNFHCGYYSDSDALEKILHFQRDSTSSYIEWITETIPRWRRVAVKIIRHKIVRYMLKHSDPLKALLNKDATMIQHFFRSPPILSSTHSE